VRIKHGQRIITCLECSSIRRFGGGPKSHRRQ
jgi:RNase P subunit RPR2